MHLGKRLLGKRLPFFSVGFAAIIALGGLATFALSRVTVTFDHAAQAAPPIGMRPALPPPTPAQVADARAFSRTFAQVAEQLKPSVVSIRVEKGGGGPVSVRRFHRGGRGPSENPFQGTPFEQFFGGFGDNNGGGEGNGFETPRQVGAGSGVVIDSRGYILTNNHVIDGADTIKVTFSDGRELTGRVAGADPKTDLAVVKVDAPNLVAARLGDSDKLAPGEWVIAIGNPFGFDHTVTVGVISAKGRSGVGGGQYEDFLQTDAAINPGNSGGPLVSLDGEVIGINTAIRGIGTMIGFAIPSSMARPIADQLIADGKVRRPYLGILMQDLTPELSMGLGAGAPMKGALVGQVEPTSPAARAGVQPGDVILAVDGGAIDGSKAVQKAVLRKRLGEGVQIKVWRNGKELALGATTVEHPGDVGENQRLAGNGTAGSRTPLGLEIQTLTPEIAERLGMAGERGVVVAGVTPGGPAAEVGLRQGDVLVEIDRLRVTSAEEATRLLRTERKGGHLARVRRGDSAQFVVIPGP